MLKIYARCIDGQADAANQRINEALGIQDISRSQSPVTREMTTANSHPEMPGQRLEAGRAVGVTAPTAPSGGFFAPVRGSSPLPTDA